MAKGKYYILYGHIPLPCTYNAFQVNTLPCTYNAFQVNTNYCQTNLAYLEREPEVHVCKLDQW